MEPDPRQSIHEIGLARQLFLSSARPAVVTVGGASREATAPKLEPVGEVDEDGGKEVDREVSKEISKEVGEQVSDQVSKEGRKEASRDARHNWKPLEQLEHLEQLEQAKYFILQRESGSMATGSDLQRGNTGPRVVFKKSVDDWSMFPNPACTHERHCGHMPRPRILFEPGGVGSDGRGSQFPQRRPGAKRLSLPASATATSRRSPTSHTESLYSQARETEKMEGGDSSELPVNIGPFLLKSLSSDSIVEGRATAESEFPPTASATSATEKKNLRALQKEFYATRTTDWVGDLDPEAPVPGHAPPLASIVADSSHVENTDDTKNMGNSRGRNQNATPIRGNFIPLSTSFKEPSPRRDQGPNGPNGVYLQFSLTDSQMDRLTAALSSDDSNEPPVPPIPPRSRARDAGREFDTMDRSSKESATSSKRSRSPAKAGQEHAIPGMRSRSPARTSRENTTPSTRSRSPAKTYQPVTTPSRARSQSPVKFSNRRTPESQRTLLGLQGNTTVSSPSKAKETRFELDTPAAHESPTRTSGRSSGRSGRAAPAPINTDLARAHARMAAVRIGKQPAIVVHNPPERAASPVRQPSQYPVADDSSSYYSQESKNGDRYPSCISPLRIQKSDEPKHLSILQAYTETAYSETKSSALDSDKASSEVEQQQAVMDEASSGAELAYTPLAPFIPQGAGPSVRKASKTLIGEGGWLENTSKPEPAATSPTRASGGFLGNLVKRAKEMIESNKPRDSPSSSSTPNSKTRPTSRQLAISLSPREQSLLFCELEFALTTALSDYLTAQFAAGRLDADKLRRAAEDWQRKGRPKVVGFRYDMETQLDLVRAHVGDFKFYARAAATTAILGVLDTAKASARVLRVRTFCQPDTVIAKQLLDAQGLFNVLGCPEAQQIKLAEVVAFFKAAIERRRVCELRERMQMEQMQMGRQGGVVATTSPVRNSRSPVGRQGGGGGGEDWYGTAAAAAAPAGQQHQQQQQMMMMMRGSNNNSTAARRMDPAGYGSQEE